MSAAATLERLAAARLIAVLRVSEPRRTAPTIAALREGGVGAVELTWTSADPARELAAARAEYGPDFLLGAGTLRTPADVEAAVAAGADFLVSPHFERELFGAMHDSGRLALPGVLTPSEVGAALDAGALAVKLFPSSLVGPAYLNVLRGPFPDLRVVPTGGVTSENAAEWLRAGAVAVGASGELCPADAIAAERWGDVVAAAGRFVATVREA
jgi:2-dehydro-3-deoxyphosphogluconate aldolase / (4S)-4-hydroxy-2-oxoglutarate aldolase